MTPTEELDIKIVYSASSSERRPHRRRTAKRTPRSTPLRQRSVVAAALIGVLTLAAAGGAIYGAWWPGERLITPTLIMKTPVMPMTEEELAIFASWFGVRHQPGSRPTDQTHSTASKQNDKETPRFKGRAAQGIIVGTATGWLILATVGACLLSMSTGAMWSLPRGSAVRRLAIVLALGAFVAVGIYGYIAWREYYPMSYYRWGMVTLVGVTWLLGLGIGRGGRSLSRVAAIVLILGGASTAAGLYLGHQCSAIGPELASPAFLAKAFVAHSLWGFLLLPLSFLLPRKA
ncbi:MAG: hypothetical protein JSV78_05815 [Phycisphaerales bacterium]|nr:MAG: hypothetical protein JSV78_05815 [Phycisphaerales bacterium]